VLNQLKRIPAWIAIYVATEFVAICVCIYVIVKRG
jgi:hypothetical protein